MTERGALKLSVFTLVLVLIAVSVVYGSLVFVSFMFYTLLLQIVPHKRDFDYVIIHGCGLLGGRRVSKLLADRLDKAIALYKKDPTPPIMIPSGGQGSDEDISEAAAMAQYLREHGIPDDHILLRYCKRIGLACTGVGAHVAAYYWPSALIREFVAVHHEKKHLLLFLIGWVLMVFPVILVLFDMV